MGRKELIAFRRQDLDREEAKYRSKGTIATDQLLMSKIKDAGFYTGSIDGKSLHLSRF